MTIDELTKQLAAIAVTLDSCTGRCPVQISGEYDRRWLYFRARGDRWQLAIHDDEDLAIDLTFADDEQDADSQGGFMRCGTYGKSGGYEAGYMPLEDAIAIIKAALQQYIPNYVKP